MKTCIICANGFEECEALLTYDLLFRAGINTDLLGLEEKVVSSHKVEISAHKLLKDVDIKEYDCLILPGGMPGTVNLENNQLVQEAIDLFMKENKLIAAVCAAPSILIHKNLLKDEEFTCYPGFENGLKSSGKKAIQTRNIITGIGLGGTIEFATLIIENMLGKEKSLEVLRQIQYIK